MTVRLIASDLDGTLFGPDHVPEPRTVEAVNAAVDAGLTFVAATGRSHFGGADLAVSTGAEVHWFIGSNGGHRLNMGTRVLEERLVFEVTVVRDLMAELPVRIAGVGFGLEHSSGFSWDDRFLDIHPLLFDGGPRRDTADVAADDVGRFLIAHAEVSSSDLVDLVKPHMPEELHVTTSGVAFVEVTPSGGDKGSALERLCATIGVEADEVIAFGDNHNDLTMLEWAGRGVAMANAVPDVIAIADEVTGSNVDFGVAQVLETLV